MNSSSRFRILLVAIGAVVLAALAGFMTSPQRAAGGAAQASITLTNCDAQFCYTHNNTWTLTKEVSANSVSNGSGTVTWTVTATKSDGGTTFTVHGGVTVINTGSAPATIGNIVVNLQKPNSPKKASNAPYVSVAADIADATNGDAATSANIVAAGSQENAATNAAWGTNNYTVAGAKGTFTETLGKSGALSFTDASDNSVFSLVPQPTIPVGGSVTLLYTASFDTSILVPGTAYRVESLVTFGNAGARGGSGSTANSIDINGNSSIDNDEANVRTVPCRHTLDPIPSTPDECNNSVTVADTGATTTGTVTTSNAFGFDVFPATITDTTSWTVSVDVNGGNDGGSVCNGASLDGEACTGTLNVIVGYTPYQYDELGNIIGGHEPIYATFECAAAAHAEDSDCADVGAPAGFQNGDYCTYGKGGYAGPGAPGQLYDNNYLTVFPSGLTIGIADGAGPKHNASWTSTLTGRANLKSYLTSPAGGANTALTADTTNATSTSGGSLPRQTAALALNVGFSNGVVSPAGFGNLKFCNLIAGSTIGSFVLTGPQATALNGTSISQVLADANNALGGNGLPAYVGSFGDLNQLITTLNGSFNECQVSSFATTYLCKP